MEYKIGDKIQLEGVDMCLSPTGAHMYLDPPIESVEGTVVQVANFIDRRLCIEFPIKFQKHTVWKYEFDLPAKA